MPESSLDLLAKELGAFAGRIEREINLRMMAAIAEINRRAAEFELRMAMFEQKAAALKDGEPGPTGPAGKDGEPGLKGENGKDGPTGRLPIVKAWSDQIHYEGMVVSHDGSTWQAQRDTGHVPPHEDWICLARAGRDGIDGASLHICGTYEATATYAALDVVVLNGGSFVAKQRDPGPCPGAGWQLIASQGKQGKPGPKGDKG
jgi:hypothetical protein